MREFVEDFSTLIVRERSWSWSVIGILYMGLTLIIRNWFMRPVIREARKIKKSWYSDFKDLYLKSALSGWAAYLISLGIVLMLWVQPEIFPLTIPQFLAAVAALFFYILSILMHLQALGVAAAKTLKSIES